MKNTLLVLVFVCLSTMLLANDLDDTMRDLSEDAGSQYVKPIVNAFGADFNTGWFTRAPSSRVLGLDISFKLVLMGAMFDDSDDHFSTTGTFRFNEAQADYILDNAIDWSQYPAAAQAELRSGLKDQLLSQDIEVGIFGPTIVGPDDENIYLQLGAQQFTVSAGTESYSIQVDETNIDTGVTSLLNDVPLLPLYTPQFTIGTLQGTNLTVRFIPPYDIEDLGKFSYWGVGVQHNPVVWLSSLVDFLIPVDLCLSASAQQMEVGSIMTASSWNFGLNVSKNLGTNTFFIAPYAGVMLEGAKIEFDYDFEYSIPVEGTDDYTQTVENVNFELESENSARLILGATLRLGVVNFNADYNISTVNTFGCGLGLGFTF